MDSQLSSDHEIFVQTSDALAQRPNSKRFMVFTVMAVVAAAILVFTAGAKPHDAHLRTDGAVQLAEYNPHGVCIAPAPHFARAQIGCPSDRTDSCLLGNRDYAVFADAWAACGRVPECGAIMRWTSGNYYLRRRGDPHVPMAGAFSMFYSCGGQGHTAASTYTVRNRHCQPPTTGFNLPPMGCKGSFPGGCLGGRNANFTTFADAWEACGVTEGCGAIMRWTTQGLYYLRRLEDPTLIKEGAASISYTCDGLHGEEHHNYGMPEGDRKESEFATYKGDTYGGDYAVQQENVMYGKNPRDVIDLGLKEEHHAFGMPEGDMHGHDSANYHGDIIGSDYAQLGVSD